MATSLEKRMHSAPVIETSCVIRTVFFRPRWYDFIPHNNVPSVPPIKKRLARNHKIKSRLWLAQISKVIYNIDNHMNYYGIIASRTKPGFFLGGHLYYARLIFESWYDKSRHCGITTIWMKVNNKGNKDLYGMFG